MDGNKSASIAFALMAKLPLRFPAGDGKLADRRVLPGGTKGQSAGFTGGDVPGRSAAAENFVVADVELAKQPIEAEFLQIVLIDLDELRFDLDLFRTGNVRLLNDRIHQFEIVGGVAHD